eukprot:7638501-Alexandrium_andersonii.AAC.1
MSQLREAELAIRHGSEEPRPPERNPRAPAQVLQDYGMQLPQGGFTQEGFVAPRIDHAALWYFTLEAPDVASDSSRSPSMEVARGPR